jgi:hypothetical protein
MPCGQVSLIISEREREIEIERETPPQGRSKRGLISQ